MSYPNHHIHAGHAARALLGSLLDINNGLAPGELNIIAGRPMFPMSMMSLFAMGRQIGKSAMLQYQMEGRMHRVQPEEYNGLAGQLDKMTNEHDEGSVDYDPIQATTARIRRDAVIAVIEMAERLDNMLASIFPAVIDAANACETPHAKEAQIAEILMDAHAKIRPILDDLDNEIDLEQAQKAEVQRREAEVKELKIMEEDLKVMEQRVKSRSAELRCGPPAVAVVAEETKVG